MFFTNFCAHFLFPWSAQESLFRPGVLRNDARRNGGGVRGVLGRERRVFWNIFLTVLRIWAVCFPVYYVLFTCSYVAFCCGRAFQFSRYILRALARSLTLVSVSDDLDSKRLLRDVTADIRVLWKFGLETFASIKWCHLSLEGTGPERKTFHICNEGPQKACILYIMCHCIWLMCLIFCLQSKYFLQSKTIISETYFSCGS